MLATLARLLIDQYGYGYQDALHAAVLLCDARTTRRDVSIPSPQLSMISVSTTAAMLALCVPLVPLCVPSSSIMACQREESVWGSSCFDWTSPGARPQHRVVRTVAAPVNLNGHETRVGVRSLAQRIVRLHTSPAVFCYLFSEAGLAGQYRGSLPLPSPGDVSLRCTLLVGLQ